MPVLVEVEEEAESEKVLSQVDPRRDEKFATLSTINQGPHLH